MAFKYPLVHGLDIPAMTRVRQISNYKYWQYITVVQKRMLLRLVSSLGMWIFSGEGTETRLQLVHSKAFPAWWVLWRLAFSDGLIGAGTQVQLAFWWSCGLHNWTVRSPPPVPAVIWVPYFLLLWLGQVSWTTKFKRPLPPYPGSSLHGWDPSVGFSFILATQGFPVRVDTGTRVRYTRHETLCSFLADGGLVGKFIVF